MKQQEQSFIEYPNWPEWVKVMTALYWKPGLALAKKPSNLKALSGMSFAVGIFVLLTAWGLKDSETPLSSKLDFSLIFLGILNIFLGVLNFTYNYKTHTWINQNSSWEERFANKSIGKHKFQYLLLWVGLFAVSIGITCLICC